jgi:hypothetical protein
LHQPTSSIDSNQSYRSSRLLTTDIAKYVLILYPS